MESGKIVSCDPKAGKVIKHTEKVSIVVSKGKEPATIPDVTGQSEDEAKKALEDAGLKVEVNKRLGGPFGTVRSTDPAPGSSVKPDSKVTINIF